MAKRKTKEEWWKGTLFESIYETTEVIDEYIKSKGDRDEKRSLADDSSGNSRDGRENETKVDTKRDNTDRRSAVAIGDEYRKHFSGGRYEPFLQTYKIL